MLLKTGEERKRRKMKETDRAEGAGLMKVSDQEESEWELFKLSVQINTEFYDIGLLLIQSINF